MEVWLVSATEYWRNYRGESGSVRSHHAVFDSEDKASRYIADFRRSCVDSQTKDTSDEPGRWLRLTDRVTGFIKLDMWVEKWGVE